MRRLEGSSFDFSTNRGGRLSGVVFTVPQTGGQIWTLNAGSFTDFYVPMFFSRFAPIGLQNQYQ